MSCPVAHGAKSAAVDPLKPAGECPAFANGCPFSTGATHFQDTLKQCPAFSSGCPFKSGEEMQKAVAGHLAHVKPDAQVPDLHGVKDIKTLAALCPAFQNGCPFQSGHESFKKELARCPAFENGCPYKSAEASDSALLHHIQKETAHTRAHSTKHIGDAVAAFESVVKAVQHRGFAQPVTVSSSLLVGASTVTLSVQVPTAQ